MNPICALGLNGFDFGTEIGEISREDGRGNFNRTVERHGSASFAMRGLYQ
jgi:hypothetical protein